MEIEATCRMCGKTYIKKNGRSMFCSDACRKARAKQRYETEKDERLAYQRKWREEHPEAKEKFAEKHPTYDRDRFRRIRGSREYTKICLACGKTFTTWRPNKGTCSDECKAARRRARDSHRHRNRTRSPEEEHKRYTIRKYGSEEAHMAHLEKKQAQIEQAKASKKREREERLAANFREGECVVCGKAFTTYNPQQKTCCSECGKKLSYARKQKRIPKAQMVDKDITLEALYRRDSGVCYLCGGQCDWNDIIMERNCVGRNYPSIDHIVPVSRGGLHAWNNVRLAHFGCNLEKSDSLIPDVEKLIPKNAYQFKRNVRPRKRKTLQFAKDMTLIAEYESTAEAERITGIAQKKIQDCARGRHKTSGGYVWRYAQ
jgi:predicted nucleic acid-binding Zn ribbon protein